MTRVPSPRRGQGVYFYHHEAMRSKVRDGPAVHTVWHPLSLGYPGADSTVLHCTARPQETGLKIQSIAPFKGSAGNSWKQTAEGKRCVFERCLLLKATHSSLMNRQLRNKLILKGQKETTWMDRGWLENLHFRNSHPLLVCFSWSRNPPSPSRTV